MVMETYKYNSVTMARLIVAYANDNGFSINMTKAQKLLYIAYGLYLAVNKKRLVNEHPQAWPYGPVFPTTRNKLLKVDMYAIRMNDEELAEMAKDEDAMGLLDLVFRSFGNWTASELTGWSHKEGSPWDITVNTENFRWGDTISDDDINYYFSSILRKK